MPGGARGLAAGSSRVPRLSAPNGAPLQAGGTWVAAGAHFLSRGSAHVSLEEGRSGVRSAESQRPSHGG